MGGSLGFSPQSNKTMPDGSILVSGSSYSASQKGGNLYGFQLASGDLIRQKSQYTLYNLNDYLKQQSQTKLLPIPELTNDSGYVRLLASSAMTLNGSLRLPDGVLDISVPGQKISISSDDKSTANNFSATGLSSIRASSLLLGGVRTPTKDPDGQAAYSIQNQSQSLEIANSQATSLLAGDVILASLDSITLGNGSSIVSDRSPRIGVAGLFLSGDGALVRVTGGPYTQV